MRTIRQQVFETNSSSEHCIAFVDAKRKPDEFPVVRSDGVLEIEVKHYWECGAVDTITNKVVDIIEYLYCVAMSCSVDRPASMGLFLDDLRRAYETYGLVPPTDVHGYVVDDKGTRHKYNDIVHDSVDYMMPYSPTFIECYFNSLLGYKGMGKAEFEEFYRLHKGYVDEKVIKFPRRIGIDPNIIWEDYHHSTEQITELNSQDDKSYTALDLLITPSTLYFYRT